MNTPRLHHTFALIMAVAALTGLLAPLALPNQVTPTHASSNILYVAPSGDDMNTCSSAAPCRTVQHAVDIAASGDEIRVATGVYTDISARRRHPGCVHQQDRDNSGRLHHHKLDNTLPNHSTH